jgi:hypothetical protein
MDRNWETKEIIHEGFPLLLRYPEKQNVSSIRSAFPTLAVITHHFSEVRNNGLPYPDYNDTLFDFDAKIREAFESKDLGLVMLIETFAGKRNYYIYSILDADIANILADTTNQYSQHKITWLTRLGPNWNFIDKYTCHFLE